MSDAGAVSNDVVVFVAPDWVGTVAPGDEQDYGKVSDFFTRKKEDLAAEWDKIVSQMGDLLTRLSMTIESFELHEVQFGLGFSAEGHLGFIAKAGATASVTVTFQRKS